MELHVCKDYDELSEHIANWMVDQICKTLSVKERFSIALTGGNTPKELYKMLASETYKNKIDWSRANIFIGDERFVPYDDKRSNAKMIRETLIDHIAVNNAHVHFMQTENIQPETAALNYEILLKQYFKDGNSGSTFDIVLLGMGDDAHTLSLFPGHKEVIEEQKKWCTYLWLQQQDMYRITLTASVVNAAQQVAFLVNGANKTIALSNVLHKQYDPVTYPSQIIKPVNGELHWFVDEAAMNS
ncbi:MAG: 6-phosphogluconolactonase [Bacteroidetes bacterium]|nr:6-phosphogluconolactonase [Bacteroidota bacterium]